MILLILDKMFTNLSFHAAADFSSNPETLSKFIGGGKGSGTSFPGLFLTISFLCNSHKETLACYFFFNQFIKKEHKSRFFFLICCITCAKIVHNLFFR